MTGPQAPSPPLLDRVRHRLIRDGSAADQAAVQAALGAEPALLADDRRLADLARSLSAEITGAGPLEALLVDPAVTDVLVNGPSEVWVDRGAGMQRATVRFPDEAAVRLLAVRLAAAAGRRLDDAAPFADATLADGTRVHAVLPPLVAGTAISLRTFRRRTLSLDDLLRAGTIPPDARALVEAIVASRLGFVISGGTGSGKTGD